MKIQGEVALVTGAAKRVGRAIVLALARRGAKLAIHYHHSKQEAAALAQEALQLSGQKASIFRADLSNVTQVQRLADSVVAKFGSIHVLVNNASIYEKNIFGKTSQREWDNHLDINLRAPFFLSQHLGLRMKAQGRGKIINIGDWSVGKPNIEYIPYSLSKAGLLCLNASLARALAPEVQVNAVLPGPVLLPEGTAAEMKERIRGKTLLKRIGTPEDVAQTVIFLIEGSDYITGAAIHVDGGRALA